jgi:hypothetical protein
MSDLMTDLAPLAALMFVAACVLWLVWRAIRGLFRSSREVAPVASAAPAYDVARREPVLAASRPVQTTIPDAADVLALKASIDALTKQIGLLERRLAPANTNVLAAPRAPATPSAEPEEKVARVEPPLIVPDRRI